MVEKISSELVMYQFLSGKAPRSWLVSWMEYVRRVCINSFQVKLHGEKERNMMNENKVVYQFLSGKAPLVDLEENEEEGDCMYQFLSGKAPLTMR